MKKIFEGYIPMKYKKELLWRDTYSDSYLKVIPMWKDKQNAEFNSPYGKAIHARIIIEEIK